jgi:hypothetical protein
MNYLVYVHHHIEELSPDWRAVISLYLYQHYLYPLILTILSLETATSNNSATAQRRTAPATTASSGISSPNRSRTGSATGAVLNSLSSNRARTGSANSLSLMIPQTLLKVESTSGRSNASNNSHSSVTMVEEFIEWKKKAVSLFRF